MINKIKKLNYCSPDRLPCMQKASIAVSNVWCFFTYGTECACCLGTRLIILIVVTFLIGYII